MAKKKKFSALDVDHDGKVERWERRLDTDHDGKVEAHELKKGKKAKRGGTGANDDFDGDGIKNSRDKDDDNDGICDSKDKNDFHKDKGGKHAKEHKNPFGHASMKFKVLSGPQKGKIVEGYADELREKYLNSNGVPCKLMPVLDKVKQGGGDHEQPKTPDKPNEPQCSGSCSGGGPQGPGDDGDSKGGDGPQSFAKDLLKKLQKEGALPTLASADVKDAAPQQVADVRPKAASASVSV